MTYKILLITSALIFTNSAQAEGPTAGEIWQIGGGAIFANNVSDKVKYSSATGLSSFSKGFKEPAKKSKKKKR